MYTCPSSVPLLVDRYFPSLIGSSSDGYLLPPPLCTAIRLFHNFSLFVPLEFGHEQLDNLLRLCEHMSKRLSITSVSTRQRSRSEVPQNTSSNGNSVHEATSEWMVFESPMLRWSEEATATAAVVALKVTRKLMDCGGRRESGYWRCSFPSLRAPWQQKRKWKWWLKRLGRWEGKEARRRVNEIVELGLDREWVRIL